MVPDILRNCGGLKILGTNYPVTQYHIPNEWIPQQSHYLTLLQKSFNHFSEHSLYICIYIWQCLLLGQEQLINDYIS